MQDLEKVDKLYHALKSLATYSAMKEAENYTDSELNENVSHSGYRGRAMNGRFVSRENANDSYAEGYSRGYSEAIDNRMNNSANGYPAMPYPNRRW